MDGIVHYTFIQYIDDTWRRAHLVVKNRIHRLHMIKITKPAEVNVSQEAFLALDWGAIPSS